MKTSNKPYNQGRREFFTKLELTSSLPPMALGCSEKPKFQGSGKAPNKIWEEMLHYVKTSPDYLRELMGGLNTLIGQITGKVVCG